MTKGRNIGGDIVLVLTEKAALIWARNSFGLGLVTKHMILTRGYYIKMIKSINC